MEGERQKVDQQKTLGVRVRAMKDTICALEDDAAFYHLSHDTPH